MPSILMVCNQSELDAAEMLEEELSQSFRKRGIGLNLITSLNAENAREQLPGNFSLVITSLHIRKAPRAPYAEKDEEGIELLLWMNKNGMNKPSILIAPTRTAKLEAAQPELKNCCVVYSSARMVEDIVAFALQLTDKTPARCLDIEIDLRSRNRWNYRLTGTGFGFFKEQELTIDEETLQYIETLSRTIEFVPNWRDVLWRIGSKLLDALWKDREFMGSVMEGLWQAGGQKHARVRFGVKPDLHSLALEAVLCPQEQDRYWMLSAPICRRLSVRDPSMGGFLFQGGQKIHCLVIDGATSGLFQDEDVEIYLSKVPNVSRECDWLSAWLNSKRSDFNIGDIRLLRQQPEDEPLAQQVRDALESRDWGIIHFGGHSYYDIGNDVGYVFLPDGGDGRIRKVDLNRFSDWLRRVTFVYFSSCDSGAGPFVFGLANRRVPNILGFRWGIKDPLAFEYSMEFYKTLFEQRSLDQAFLRARQQMYGLHPDDRIWAAPILIKQLAES